MRIDRGVDESGILGQVLKWIHPDATVLSTLWRGIFALRMPDGRYVIVFDPNFCSPNRNMGYEGIQNLGRVEGEYIIFETLSLPMHLRLWPELEDYLINLRSCRQAIEEGLLNKEAR